MIQIKNLNKELHIDYLTTLVKTLPRFRGIAGIKQVVVNDSTVLVKGSKGRYAKSYSLNELVNEFDDLLFG